ncbi:MAG: hypothetical protein CVT63_02775 [Candidatus Anoxymicrobium japonicum]|uniref:Uncharacterized protein n=1 Tax=Candidatus Anoxymicrobium japonicum TaxID=2013648 RepID=A0A2N3G6W1_9ACTN|nr:MAG: hypothetical protein CVT63_02775 [Candidatus Anoxymicrobium japonicum]
MSQRIKKMKPKSVDERNSETSSVKIAWIVGAVGLCVLLVAGIAIATGGGSRKNGAGIMAQASPAATPATTSSSTPASSGLIIEQVQVPPLSIYKRRNPFEPLVNMETPMVESATQTGAGVRVVNVPPELRRGASSQDAIASTAITLDGILREGGNSFAKLRVGDQTFDRVEVGGVFGEHYKLLTVGGNASATVLFGDERVTIFTGQSIYI